MVLKRWRGKSGWLGIVEKQVAPVNNVDAETEGLEKNLRELQRLRDDGLLTETEHAAARARLLAEPAAENGNKGVETSYTEVTDTGEEPPTSRS